MGFFDRFKGQKPLTEAQERWNRLWFLWFKGGIESPYEELMTYQSEVTNGGHGQYFINTPLWKTHMQTLRTILPDILWKNLQAACDAFEAEDDETLAECDAVFDRNQHLAAEILQAHADTLPR